MTVLRSAVSLSLVIGLCAGSKSAQAEELLEHVEQLYLNSLIADGKSDEAFIYAFEAGDELTEFDFTDDLGVGANIGKGRLFSRMPRADLNGPGEWANHFPKREGGAVATSCISCHNSPIDNGGGGISVNVVIDPGHTGDPSMYLDRNTPPLFALSIPQRLAEEMTVNLFLQRTDASLAACETGFATTELSAKGVSFGSISITRVSEAPCAVDIDTSSVDGVDPDLVVKPFGWKGHEASLRSFTRGAAHNEMGLQGTELVGAADGDFDGITHELTVGDVTALTIYMAGLERPSTLVELADLGLAELSDLEIAEIASGEERFEAIGCSSCHTPAMTLNDAVFREPSPVPGFNDGVFPDGSDPAGHGLLQDLAVSFDMLSDQPNNQLMLDDGTLYRLGSLQTDDAGHGVAHWFTDFKRHNMGAALADPSAPLGIPAAYFLTRSLAGVGSTGPWLHDGRATTLAGAIMAHGGEASQSREAYAALSDDMQNEVLAFLNNLVIFKIEEEEEDQ